MWRVFNKLFRWQYVTYMYGSTMSIGRVQRIGEIYFVYECCTGYVPLTKEFRQPFPLTMTTAKLKEMIEHNESVLNNRVASK